MISVAVLVAAVFTSSATAASLDVEPVETTTAPVVQDTNSPNSASNATSDSMIGLQKHACEIMKYANWDEFKYACAWEHITTFSNYYNHFFKRFDGSVVMDCGCNKDLWIYSPWHPRWTFSEMRHVTCFSRDGRDVSVVKSEFDAYSC